jgi:hypothetical protein
VSTATKFGKPQSCGLFDFRNALLPILTEIDFLDQSVRGDFILLREHETSALQFGILHPCV